jgi:excisionase family DNA binding protein
MMNNRLLSINEAATILGISKHTLNGWVSKRQISFVKVGRRTLFDPSYLAQYIKAHTVEPQARRETR